MKLTSYCGNYQIDTDYYDFKADNGKLIAVSRYRDLVCVMFDLDNLGMKLDFGPGQGPKDYYRLRIDIGPVALKLMVGFISTMDNKARIGDGYISRSLNNEPFFTNDLRKFIRSYREQLEREEVES